MPAQGGRRGLHAASFIFGAVWGWVWGGGSCCDRPCAKLLGEGDPNLPGNGAELGAGGAQPGFSTEPPTPGVPRTAPRPLHACLGPCCCTGGSLGTPTALLGVCTPRGSGSVWGGRAQRPAVRAGGGQVPLAGSRPPLPETPSPLHHWGCLGRGCPVVPSHGWLPPTFGHMSPGGAVSVPPPRALAHPLAGTHELWCSRLWIHYCSQTAATGWAGGVCRAPPAWGPPCAPSWWGWGALAPGARQAGLCVPQGLQTGLWAPKNPGDPPQNCLGAGGVRGGHSPSPLSCSLGSGGARSVPCDPPRSVSSPPQCFCVSPPRGELSPCEVCVSREWVVAAPVNKTAS